jgi:hypothetical protein
MKIEDEGLEGIELGTESIRLSSSAAFWLSAAVDDDDDEKAAVAEEEVDGAAGFFTAESVDLSS